jgi:hypothetical protein
VFLAASFSPARAAEEPIVLWASTLTRVTARPSVKRPNSSAAVSAVSTPAAVKVFVIVVVLASEKVKAMRAVSVSAPNVPLEVSARYWKSASP